MEQMYIDLSFTGSCALKFLLSIIYGFLLGMERKSRNHFVGSRTLILISVSSTLLTIASSYMADYQAMFSTGGGDPTRIAAGLVSGIGFLGGGAILRQGLNIKGLTSAAVIWAASALGLALGANLYIESFLVLLVILFLLHFIEKIETRFFPFGHNKMLHLCFENSAVDVEELKKIVSKYGYKVFDTNISRVFSTGMTVLHLAVKTPRKQDDDLLIEDLKKVGNLSEFSITD